MRAAGESQRSPGPPRAFGPVLVRLNFKSRRQRSERQSAERFYAAACQRSYRLKAPSVDIRARAADPRSPRRRCAPRRSNSKSTRPRSPCPWWRAGPRSCAGRRSAGAVMRGRARVRVRRLVASSLKLALRAPSDPAGLRGRAASVRSEPRPPRSLAAEVCFLLRCCVAPRETRLKQVALMAPAAGRRRHPKSAAQSQKQKRTRQSTNRANHPSDDA